MKRFRRAVFCYYILGFPAEMHPWLILVGEYARRDGHLTIGADVRQHTAQWLVDFFSRHVDFESAMHVLLGDAFFEQNRRDVGTVERIAGRRIIDLWDTDPIFTRYPHLRGLARNFEFEQQWARVKKIAMEKQK